VPNELKVFSGNAHRELALEVCDRLGVSLGRSNIFKFSNDCTFVQIEESIREDDVYVIQPSCYPVNDGLIELFIMLDAIRRASASRITVVTPYFPYAKSDKKDQPRVAITARLVADLLQTSGADRVVAVDLHAPQVQGFFTIPFDHLTSLPVLARYFLEEQVENLIVVAPDAGRAKLARSYAKLLHTPIAIIDKYRTGNDENVCVDHLVGDVDGKNALLIDDEIASGKTIVSAAKALKEFGADRVYVACAHPVLSDDAPRRLADSPIDKVVVTNTLPVPEHKRIDKLVIVSVARILADAIQRIHNGESVGELFDNLYGSLGQAPGSGLSQYVD